MLCRLGFPAHKVVSSYPIRRAWPNARHEHVTTFDPAYVEGAVKPFFLSTKYEGEPPLLPMIDFALNKEGAVQPHIFGMLYDNWTPNMDEEGVPVR